MNSLLVAYLRGQIRPSSSDPRKRRGVARSEVRTAPHRGIEMIRLAAVSNFTSTWWGVGGEGALQPCVLNTYSRIPVTQPPEYE